ncbi:MAG: hypothetical protein K2O75_09680 [Lactobacillus sp.]|uniref:hypothetical protein n=1 Tax=Lactobacillus sp. TaxID=1591 RepID=UPI0023D26F3D|nr:hypothetical protein [Lactobacillus sp.]MDE7051115.1 hypothetical protein [Lactobacillus sp.]
MRPDLIAKNRKLNRLLGVVGVILSVVILFLAFINLGWLYRLVGLCAIIYYLVDIEQGLEESHAITRLVRIILVVIGILYIGLSMVCVFWNVDLLLRLFGLAGAAYLGFKSYQLVRSGIFNKKLRLIDSLVAVILGLFPAILLIIYTFWYFWLILLAFTLLYNLVHLIVRIKIERGPTNREL